MKKQKKQMIVVIVILAVALAAYLGLHFYNKSASESTSEEDEDAIYVNSVETEDITAFSYPYGGEQIDFVKDGETWTCEQYPEYELDTDSVDQLAAIYHNMKADQIVEDPEDDDTYGLNDSTYTLTYTTADGEVTITVGMENTMLDGWYVRTSASDDLYLVEDVYFDGLMVSPDTLVVEEEETEEESEITEEETSEDESVESTEAAE